ncbi:hypothetical protein CANINC_004692 [Pichia inconspicua]|uniref:Uncharacterized protein n=1 Tax=Pichia inconspicua TaxID=52247 RepID=A0A4T0WW02_9ASCO|nr:hypothetical protein CANINC_004692 [[Candida] inconspicua]
MVNLCYITTATCATIPLAYAINIEHAKLHNQVLLPNTQSLTVNNLPHLTKRGTYSKAAVKAKMDFGVYDIDEDKSSNIVDVYEPEENEGADDEGLKKADAETKLEKPYEEAEVKSYAFRKLQKKLGIKDKKFEMPVTGPVPDWDDQFYDHNGTPIVYQVNTEELKDILDHYIEMGKEKWAGFLATSNCNKFQKLLNKLKKKMDDDCDEESVPIRKPDTDTGSRNHNKEEEEEEEEEYDEAVGEESTQEQKDVKSLLKKPSPDFGKNKNKDKPAFSNLPEDELNSFQEMLSDVIAFWQKEDAREILEASKGLSYEEFELDGDDFELVKQHKDKSKKKKGAVSVYDYDNYLTEEDVEMEDPEGTEYYETPEIDEYTKHNPNHLDVLESLQPEIVKTKKQKDWLRDNAVRRAKILQALLNGQFDEYNLRQDIVKYRDNDIFLDQDENEFISSGIKIESKKVLMCIFFAVEAFMFQLL